MPLPASVLHELAGAAREGRMAAIHGTHVRAERAISNAAQIGKVIEACKGPVQSRVSSYNGYWSFAIPTARFTHTVQTIGLWHCDENTGAMAADSSDNGNTLALANCTWVAGKFTNGLSFNGTSSVATATVTSNEPVRKFLYFAAWCNPTSGPIFNWADVMEVYISGGNLCADIEGVTYTGPPIGSGWQLLHCQFYAGSLYIGVGDIIWKFAHTDDTLTVPAWAIEIGKRGSDYYSGTMDEIRLVADVVVHDDWGKCFYRAQESSIMYCTFDLGSGTAERHQDFFGPTMTLAGPTWITGYIGKAISFDGSDDYATFIPAATTSDELSIHLIVKFDALTACTLLDQEDGLNLAWDGTHFLAALDGVTNPASQIGAGTLAIATWYDIALTYDGANKSIWVNGQKTGQVAATGTVSIPANAIYLGKAHDGAVFFSGDLDFLHIAKSLLKPQYRPIKRFVLGQDGFENGEDWVLLED